MLMNSPWQPKAGALLLALYDTALGAEFNRIDAIYADFGAGVVLAWAY
jgi:hypothetical protein